MRLFLSGLMILTLSVMLAAQASGVQSFNAGGRPIAIPSPAAGMDEVGYDARELMEVFVPTTNRLIAAFLKTADVSLLTGGRGDFVVSRYAMVQVPRRGEFLDVETTDFRTVTESVRREFGDGGLTSIQSAEEEIRRRMKALQVDADVRIGQPVPLGVLFSKPDAFGFGLVSDVSMGARTMQMAMGGALLRVKKRLIFVYLYAEYQDEETIPWLRKTTEAWADNILAANS